MLEFSRPVWLLLLLVLPVIYWLGIRASYASLGPVQRWVSLGVRFIVWILLVFSLAGAQFVRWTDRMSVIVVRDSSDSVSNAQLDAVDIELSYALGEMRKDDTLGKVNFGAEAYIELLPKEGVDRRLLEDWQTTPRGNFTNIAQAMQLAVASFPDNAQKRLVLVTDGNENVGNALAEARVARDHGVELYTVPLQSEIGAEVVLESLDAPSQAAIGETVSVRFVLNSTVATRADVSLIRNGEFVDRVPIDIKPGKEAYEFPVEVDRSGFNTYELAVEPELDTIAANNRAYTFTVVHGQPRLLYATGDPAELAFLPRTLQTHNIAVDVVPPGGIPYSMEDFQTYDGIIFSDVAAYDISAEQMKLVQVMVRDFARGFMMIGGEKSFGPGGYFNTPIEETLPVDMDFRRKRITPSTLIVCLVDKSGSMGMTVGAMSKIAMAKEACKEVVKLQGPEDYVGVMGFDGIGQWVVRPTKGIDKTDILNQISQMEAGGGTDLYPALNEAYEAAKQIPVQIKHFLVFTDGVVAPADFEDLTKRMTVDNITISTVAFGTDADIPFMQSLADMGGGNMYTAANEHDLPRIFTREVFLANKATLNEDPFVPRLNGSSALTSGIPWSSVPYLYGYVATSAKDRAQVQLLTEKDDPLLATWRYGLGKSAAFTSDAKNRWARDWLGWGGYETFFTGVARWIRSDLDTGRIQVATSMIGREGIISVSAVDESGRFLESGHFEARVTDPQLDSRTVLLRQVAPGEYEGRFDIADNGNYFVNVVELGDEGTVNDTGDAAAGVSEGGQVAVSAQAGGLAVSYSPEYRNLEPNTFLLTQLRQSSIAPEEVSLAGLFSEGRVPAKRLEDAWELFVLIALLLWLFDVAARRLVLDYADWRLALATVVAGPAGRRALRTRESLAGLLSAKERATGRMPQSRGVPDQVNAPESAASTRRRELDAAAKSRERIGASTTAPDNQPGGEIRAQPRERQAQPSDSGLTGLRQKIARGSTTDAEVVERLAQLNKDRSESGGPKRSAELSDREVTSRLLERKRKSQDDR